MRRSNLDIKNAIIEAALPNVPFDGWTQAMLEQAAVSAGYEAAMVTAVFPKGVKDALIHLSDWADQQALARLRAANPVSMRVRDRITLGVRTRLAVLEPHKEAERLALSYWMRPLRKIEGAKLVWKTADVIWDWAGDTATDYNRYTKRSLLCGVIVATTLFWLTDTSQDQRDTDAFLDRRIDNALSIGKIAGRLKKA